MRHPTTRNQRRKHLRRFDNLALRISKRCGSHWTRFRRNRKPCSCPLCANPRKAVGEVTLQEKRAQMSAQEELA